MADAAPGVRALLLTVLLAGCASGGERWWPQTATKAGSPGPAAIWGHPETEGDAGLFCNGAVVTVWLASEEPLSPGTPVPIRAGTAGLALPERFVADGLGMAAFDIPVESALATALAGDARELRFQWPEGPGRLPLGKVTRQLVRNCLTGDHR